MFAIEEDACYYKLVVTRSVIFKVLLCFVLVARQTWGDDKPLDHDLLVACLRLLRALRALRALRVHLDGFRTTEVRSCVRAFVR